MEAPYFLVSSFDHLPEHRLHGFCFQEADLILGDEGYDKYRADKGRAVLPGQDGSYIVVQHSDNEAVIGTDFSGYHKLFLYRHNYTWAVSNSLLALAEFASAKRLPVTIDESHLSSFFINGPFGDQLTALHTSVKEIKLVPAMMEVAVSTSFFAPKVSLRPSRAVESLHSQTGTYEEAIRRYLRVWVGRMGTVLQSHLHVWCDLTGGRDSRAVLALFLATSRRLEIGGTVRQRVKFRSSEAKQQDFVIASRIANELGLSLDDTVDDDNEPLLHCDPAESYAKWKYLCLGVYAPVYFPWFNPDPRTIRFQGTGGEGHRRFYPDVAPAYFVEKQRNFVPSSQLFDKLKTDILDDLDYLRQGPEAAVSPMILHYRHFRDRCHGGRHSQYRYASSPLGSGLLHAASTRCSAEKIERCQILADILLNGDPRLGELPFDKPEKAIDARHIADLVDACSDVTDADMTGRVYSADQVFGTAGHFSERKALSLLREEFLKNYERVAPSGFFPKAYLDLARGVMEDAASRGWFSHARDASAISHAILAGELSRLSR